ncbi:hypothetical protein HDV00_007731 [Rhizophlyctis rosea]|nr:hypothetical protein HDV00_007731 [Rhizophlyctis rosea]
MQDMQDIDKVELFKKLLGPDGIRIRDEQMEAFLSPWFADIATDRTIKSLVHRCAFCNNENGKLLRCQGCSFVRYCNRDHQRAHWKVHKAQCQGLRKLGSVMTQAHEKAKEAHNEGLRHLPMHLGPNDYVSDEEMERHYKGQAADDHHMMYRKRTMDFALKHFKTLDPLQTFLHDTMWLTTCADRPDPHRIRDYIPPLLLRLNKDQKCYDFIKWYATQYKAWLAQDDNAWWRKILLNDGKFLNITNANAFEDVEYLNNVNFNLLVAAMLVKLRILLDLEVAVKKDVVQDESAPVNHLEPRFPIVIRQGIPAKHVYRSSILANGQSLVRPPYNVKILKSEFEKQVHCLFALVERTNKHFWKILLNPEAHIDVEIDQPIPWIFMVEGRQLGAKSKVFAPVEGSLKEAQATLQKYLDAWKETEGALEWVRGKVEKKK